MGCSSSKQQAGTVKTGSQHRPNSVKGGGKKSPTTVTHEDSTNSANDLSKGLAGIQEVDLEERYEITKVIGRGSIGEVCIVKRKPGMFLLMASNASLDSSRLLEHSSYHAGKLYAMKTIYVTRMNQDMVKEFENEVAMLRTLHHPNIIHLREVYKFKEKIYMLMDLCSGGHLNRNQFSEPEVCEVITQIMRALAYMHDEMHMAHRDLKCENIMIDNRDPIIVKLIDFGLSQVFSRGGKMRAQCGTVYAIAPEVLSGQGYTQKADIWSVGVVAFILLSHEFPFLRDDEDLRNPEMLEKLENAAFEFSSSWDTVSEPAKDVVKNLLKKMPGYRWSAKEALVYCAKWKDALNSQSYADLQARKTDLPAEEKTENHTALRQSVTSSMVHFAEYTNLRRAALMITAHYLDKEELLDLKDAFLEIDSEQNGVITYAELRDCLLKQNIAEEEVKKIFDAMDLNGTGRLRYMEFLAATLEARGFFQLERILEAFERMDVDGTGYITATSLRNILTKACSPEVIEKIIEEASLGEDGKISLDEFVEMMTPSKVGEVVELTHRESLTLLSPTHGAGVVDDGTTVTAIQKSLRSFGTILDPQQMTWQGIRKADNAQTLHMQKRKAEGKGEEDDERGSGGSAIAKSVGLVATDGKSLFDDVEDEGESMKEEEAREADVQVQEKA